MLRQFAFCFLAIFTLISGCSDPAEEKVGTIELPIYDGKKDNDPIAESVVQVTNANNYLCSGVAIGKNLIVTAYHCVAKLIAKEVSCSANAPDLILEDFEPSQIKIYTGEVPKLNTWPSAFGVKIFHPNSKKLCNNDIAFVVLNSYLNVPIVTVRSEDYPGTSETFKIVGYGLNNQNINGALGYPYGVRLTMDRVPFLRKTPYEFSLVGGSLDQMNMKGGGCSGDSGGPAFSEKTRSLVGVLSRGGECDSNSERIYSYLHAHKDLLNKAVEYSKSSLVTEIVPQTKAELSCSQSRSNEETMVPAFFVFLIVVAIFRKFDLV